MRHAVINTRFGPQIPASTAIGLASAGCGAQVPQKGSVADYPSGMSGHNSSLSGCARGILPRKQHPTIETERTLFT